MYNAGLFYVALLLAVSYFSFIENYIVCQHFYLPSPLDKIPALRW